MNERIIPLVQQVQARYNELRFCQIISNAAAYGGWENKDVFYCPDYKIEEGLKRLLNI